MKLCSGLAAGALLLLAASLGAETFAVLPFANASKSPNLDWIGESISETVREALVSEGLLALDRDDREEVYRRFSLRPYAQMTRATVLKVGETLDVDQVIFGQFEFMPSAEAGAKSKGSVRIIARIVDLRKMHGGREYTELGALEDLAALENHLAWQTLQFVAPKIAPSEGEYLRQHPTIRVDAVENYTRGLLAATDDQKQRFFNQAARLDPRYSPPVFRLAQLYWERKEYKLASDWFQKVPAADTHFREATFLLGLCRYYQGDFRGAQQAFESVAATVPLNEVWNNLGVAQLRSGDAARALASFEKAREGDSTDPDYHFNAGYALWKLGRFEQAAESLRAALERSPEDQQASALLERCRARQAARPGELRSEFSERVKVRYEETAYLQLKAMLEKK